MMGTITHAKIHAVTCGASIRGLTVARNPLSLILLPIMINALSNKTQTLNSSESNEETSNCTKHMLQHGQKRTNPEPTTPEQRKMQGIGRKRHKWKKMQKTHGATHKYRTTQIKCTHTHTQTHTHKKNRRRKSNMIRKIYAG